VSDGSRRGHRTAVLKRQSEVIRAMEMERAMICAIYTKKKKKREREREMLIKVSVEKMKGKTAWKAQ